MNDTSSRYARAWQLSSTILIALAITATTWLIAVIGFFILDQADIINYSDETCYALAIITALIVLISFLLKQWDSQGSSNLYSIELVAGALLILGGVGYAYYGFTLSNTYVPNGILSGLEYVLMMIIGIYVACIGILTVLAGFLGMLSQPHMRENSPM